MEHLINLNVKNIAISGIRAFFNIVSNYDDVVSLTIGQPDFPTPSHIKEAAKQAIDDNYTTYTHNAGLIDVREAACQFVHKKYHLSYDPGSEVIVTIGASQAIDIALRTILEPGTEVMLPGPVYPGYEPIIQLCGAIPVYVDTTKNKFKLTGDLIKQNITEKTRCIILPYPSNPTGVTFTAEELIEIADAVRGKDIFILADEIYSELTYDAPHTSIASFLREQTIVVNGLSKSHSMTGWRIGFLFAPKDITKHMLKVHQYNVSCASSISQKAAYNALTEGFHDGQIMKKEYEKRLEYVYGRLVEMGFEVVKPSGAFYLFPSIQSFGQSSFDFALELVEKAGVAVVPGSAFSKFGEGFIRISYAYSTKELEKALDRLEHFVQLKRK
ncbi:aminotransferase A [Aeribacillus pallidus]|uniref:aminotransferase A n=1 Tax=Aeribacillus TaxID=1055323 RepID=UPI0007B488A3|nr:MULTISPECIES: aminotransferase A [Aeribacillus]KZM56241.1 aromatic amino acid aminotransferase [Aeribacillus pallidus]MED0652158.1 aminotransferase A [Aeribacillus composti]MED0717065.1 aminotransferase A [Aeribacillus composti]MED0746510.1 aminotransferase A [Aeribacillus composti]MED4487720.1 aminotransferase A [Aeribacillus pallidus]